MQSDYFEWDDTKAAINLAKHGVSFLQAIEVFNDRNAARSTTRTIHRTSVAS